LTLREMVIEPVTRIEGHLAIRVLLDPDRRMVAEAYTSATMFRGFEIFLKGRQALDAQWIATRICGVCSAAHSIASAESLDMALKVSPPPLGILLRNLGQEADMIYDHTLHWFQLAGPDYSESVVRKANPGWLREAGRVKAEEASAYGYHTIYDIMAGLNPLEGRLYLKALRMGRLAREAATLILGKLPHPASVVPGGIAKNLTPGEVSAYASMLMHLIDWIKEWRAVAEDLCRFLDEKLNYVENGLREANLMSYGVYEDHEAYDGKRENMDAWAVKRWVTPGVMVNGEIKTVRLAEVNEGLTESIAHSWYGDWGKPQFSDVDGKHPWNKETLPAPDFRNWDGKYSWSTSPRWRDVAVEVGPLARMWITATAGKISEAGAGCLRFTLPKSSLPEVEVEYRAPSKPNTIERLRARAYFAAWSAYAALGDLEKLLALLKRGVRESCRQPRPPEGMSRGVGMVEAPRGGLGHWSVVDGGKIFRYQVITPTNINVSPRDGEGRPGPIEEALKGTPITEPGEISGVDVVRVVRSFDPCLACTVHVYSP